MVSIKRKVTIKTKTAQEETPVAVEHSTVTLKGKQPEGAQEIQIPPASEPEKSPIGGDPESGGKSNTGKIVGCIVAAVAIFAGIYFFGIKGEDKTGDDSRTSSIEQLAPAVDTTQSKATIQADAPKDGTTEGNDAVSNTLGTTGPTETSEASAKEENEVPVSAKSEDKQVESPVSNEPSASKPIQPASSKQITINTNIAPASAPLGDNVVENAIRVIRGDFGNGQERKDKLGSAYSEIQKKVNEMYRNGQVR